MCLNLRYDASLPPDSFPERISPTLAGHILAKVPGVV